MLETLGTIGDLALVALGFGLIVFLHELGHFLAAKWAGIRVLAFAIGFGPAIFSYRKGLGIRRGSSHEEYIAWLNQEAAVSSPTATQILLSPTEYRFNALPLGGYVRMLGQEDLHPDRTSAASDSYQCRPVWKRMVVISAGVVFNLISAALLFMFVFMVGLRVPPPVIGYVAPGSPAASAILVGGGSGGMNDGMGAGVGLLPGDRVLSIGGDTVNSFLDIPTTVGVAQAGSTLDIVIEREGNAQPITYRVAPEKPGGVGLLSIGVGADSGTRIARTADETNAELLRRYLGRNGLAGVQEGAELISVADLGEVSRASQISQAVRAFGPEPITLAFRNPSGETVSASITPEASMQIDVEMASGQSLAMAHVLGLTPVLSVVAAADPETVQQGLKPGDVLVRVGNTVFPSIAEGIAEIRANVTSRLAIDVLRNGEIISLDVLVSPEGRVGFPPDDALSSGATIAGVIPGAWSASSLGIEPGSTLTAVDGTPIDTLADVARLLWMKSLSTGEAKPIEVAVAWQDPAKAVQTGTWSIPAGEAAKLRNMVWDVPFAPGVIFEPAEFVLNADGPIDAVGMGLHETRRVLISTYLTFLRLVQGSVPVQELRGPVGIAHAGTILAERGLIWILFFMALISVNLAVINFLPLPIVDGGQFLMLAYEGMRGKPLPVQFQNAVTMLGLAMILCMFLLVTFNDVRRLFGL